MDAETETEIITRYRRLRFSSDADIVRLTNARIIIIIIIIIIPTIDQHSVRICT